MMFWSLAVVMMLVAMIIVLRPLLYQKEAVSEKNILTCVSLFQTRQSELDTDVQNNVVTVVQAESMRRELEKEFLCEIEKKILVDHPDSLSHKPAPRWRSAVFVAVFIPLSGVSFYLWLGEPEIINVAPHTTTSQTTTLPSIEEMISRLELRLQQQPEDTKGWFMLARSYMELGRYGDAVNVLERLHQLASDDPDVLLQYAEALAMLQNGQLAGKPSEIISQALELDPDNATGLWFAGMAAAEQGDYEAAIVHWEKLLPYLENDTPALQKVEQLISFAGEQLATGNKAATTLTKESFGTTNQPGKSVTVNITLDPELGAEISPGDTLFVYVRALDSSPMPIAVIRRLAKDLPLNVVLDDTMAMSPQHKLSDYEEVSITARISESGNAVSLSGDFTGFVDKARVGQQAPVQIVINRQIP